MIRLKLFGNLQETGGKSIELSKDIDTVGSVLDELKRTHPELYAAMTKDDSLNEYYIVLLNGARLDVLEGMRTKINDGDELAIFPPVAGG